MVHLSDKFPLLLGLSAVSFPRFPDSYTRLNSVDQGVSPFPLVRNEPKRHGKSTDDSDSVPGIYMVFFGLDCPVGAAHTMKNLNVANAAKKDASSTLVCKAGLNSNS